ncbi:MAG: alpha/beta hydrolase [Sedimenticola sp.]|uniref:Alpha/beta hydrolase n=1 Tax=Sedimenticola thiotaurini TaxID=1543721 RepID=A0A558CU06_9GAMM|nr:alpha/beta hydrolase [Sedimenticola sp.]MCW8949765.1 alpha/beta hydrolase [Sedimenticola sp.]MCW8975210.1 alpha/beta hydrolase [Sedimenticola sp.]TVT52216.1 MAG: alpha/beta hydrolase [Sedimenticola thiotaurini]
MQSDQIILDRGEGVPVVLLHSSMSSKEQWYKLGENLRTHYRVIAIDLYGYGGSEFPPSPDKFRLTDEVSRVKGLIQQSLGEQPFHLIGHSYGGATALRYTFDHQYCVLSLGLYEPVAFHLLEQDDPGLKMIAAVFNRISSHLETGQVSAAAEDFIDFWSGVGTYAGLASDKRSLLDKQIHKVALDFQALLHEPLTGESYQAIDLPVCLLHSQESPLPTRRVAEALEQHLPQLEAHWVKGGHMAPITNASEVNPYWINFLKQQTL